MSLLNFTVDSNKCIHCGACIIDCPRSIISLSGEFPKVNPEQETNCLECQHCLAICPTGAVSVFGLQPENSIELAPDMLPSAKQMHTLLRGRRSVRHYKEENVSCEVIDELLATLTNSPTGCNDRALRFLVMDDRELMKGFLKVLVETLEGKIRNSVPVPDFISLAVAAYRQNGVDEFFRNAPHLLVISAEEKASCPKEDIDLALAYFELLAQCSGLGTTWCGFLKFVIEVAPELRSNLNLGPETPFYGMLFGYPAVRYARTVQRDNAAAVRKYGT
ncbi:MAG: nitroreductase family protein [Desulfovibrio sp.]|jgi:Fe-S-cluster-containing hydrogenase component 2|nr:nitroreductase family protein [Desulfovibrio sp.]